MTAVRGTEVWSWRSFGDSLVVGSMPDGAWHLTVETDDGRASVILPTGDVEEFGNALEVHDTCVPYDQYADEIGAVEMERDEALERVRELEGDLRHALAEIETLKSAVDLADQRARGLEQDVERMRAADEWADLNRRERLS